MQGQSQDSDAQKFVHKRANGSNEKFLIMEEIFAND